MIHTRENCVEVHPECHGKAATQGGQILCIVYLIEKEGAGRIMRWLERMATLLDGGTINDARRTIATVLNSAQGQPV